MLHKVLRKKECEVSWRRMKEHEEGRWRGSCSLTPIQTTGMVRQSKRGWTQSGEDSFHYPWHPPENNLLRLGKL